MYKKLLVLALVVAMLFTLTGLATAQGRGAGLAELEGKGVSQERIPESDPISQGDNGEVVADETETEENGVQEEDSGLSQPVGPPAFVQEMLERKISIMDPEKLTIRNRPFESDLPPVIMGGRTLIPIRAVANGLGADVEWDPEERKVTITRGETVIELYLGELIYYVNGEAQELDVEAQIISARTFVPLRFVAVALGESVDYDAETGEVSVGEVEEEIEDEEQPENDVNGEEEDSDENDENMEEEEEAEEEE